MNGRKTNALQRVQQRPGEGHLVDLTLATVGDGGVVNASLDLSTLPVPDRRFSCDAMCLRVKKTAVQLLFAQSKPVGSGLLSMVVISMTPESVDQFLMSFNDEFVSKATAAFGEEAMTEFSEAADQSVVLNSSIIMAGYSGYDGCMDFYYTSPFAMQNIGTVKKMALESIVRINLPTPLLSGLLIELTKQAKSFSTKGGTK